MLRLTAFARTASLAAMVSLSTVGISACSGGSDYHWTSDPDADAKYISKLNEILGSGAPGPEYDEAFKSIGRELCVDLVDNGMSVEQVLEKHFEPMKRDSPETAVVAAGAILASATSIYCPLNDDKKTDFSQEG